MAGTKDGGQIALRLVRPYGRRDVHLGEEGATLVVVAAVDGAHERILTLVVHDSLDDIARRQELRAIGTAEDLVDLDGRFLGHIHHRTRCHTLVVAATVGIAHLTVQQVDDGRAQVAVKGFGKGFRGVISHAQTVVAAGTEDLHRLELIHAVGNIDEHITVVLRLITLAVLGIARTATKDTGNMVPVVRLRTYVHEGVLQVRHLAADILARVVVVEGVVAAEDGIHTTYVVFHISRRLQQTRITVRGVALELLSLVGAVVLDAVLEIVVALVVAEDGAAEVVAAIDDVLNPRETVLVATAAIWLATDIGLAVT